MKVLALGGCGQEGRITVLDLIEQECVENIIIGDINIDAANEFVRHVNSDKLTSAQVDVMDQPRLRDLMLQVDVVMNFVGPYYRFGKPVLQAAIATGKDYIDICDDHDATVDLLDLHSAAEQAGITAIIGLGASPGITNLAARHGAERMDEVTNIAVNWIVTVTDVEEVETSAAIQHAFHIIDADVPQYINGQWQKVAGASGHEMFEFPVIGQALNFYTGHPEPVTLPRYIDVKNNVTCKGGSPGADELLLATKLLGLTSNAPLEVNGQSISRKELAAKLISEVEVTDESLLPPAYSGFIVTVDGKKNGQPMSYRYEISGRMSPWTGTPPSIAAVMLNNNLVDKKGAYAPEGCLDPSYFFTQMAERGLIIKYT